MAFAGNVVNRRQTQITSASKHSRPSKANHSLRRQSKPPPSQHNEQPICSPSQAVDDLNCAHFDGCSGCNIQQLLHHPPVVDKARQYLASRGFEDFKTVPGSVHGWRCRAKLAVRGKPGAPELGLFQLGSHNVSPIPDCKAHHPRVNEAVHMLQQVTAALHLPLYQEHVASGSSSSSQQRGCLRYVQLTAVPSQPGGRAEDDAQAQIQLVLVWSTADAADPSVADARRLAAALWSQGGPKQPSPLERLRAQAEAKAAAAGRKTAPSSSNRWQMAPPQAHDRGHSAGNTNRSRHSSTSTGKNAKPAGPSSITAMTAAAGAAASPLLHSVWLNFQSDHGSNKILGSEWLLMQGPEWAWQDFGGVQLALAPGSFVQANYGAMQQCLAAIAAATPAGASVLELYAGSGVIGLSLAAQRLVRNVVCVEVNPESAGGFQLSKARLAQRDEAAAAKVIHHVASAGDLGLVQQLLQDSQADVLVVDPPRKGLDPAVLQLLTTLSQNQKAAGSHCSTDGSSVGEIRIDGGGSSNSSASCNAELPGDQHDSRSISWVDEGGAKGVEREGPSPVAQPVTVAAAAAAPDTQSHSAGSCAGNTLRRIVYLSCGFPAFMKDADELMQYGWRLISCQAYFFFPGTDSIETLAVFDRL